MTGSPLRRFQAARRRTCPYGASGPYGANGPLHNQTNPIGNAATCVGLLTYILRGGTLQSFVHASVLPGQGS